MDTAAAPIVHAFTRVAAADATPPTAHLLRRRHRRADRAVRRHPGQLGRQDGQPARRRPRARPGRRRRGRACPPHWQTAAVLLGCWSAGLAVDLGGRAGTAGRVRGRRSSTAGRRRRRCAADETVRTGAGSRWPCHSGPVRRRARSTTSSRCAATATTSRRRAGRPDDRARWPAGALSHADLPTAAAARRRAGLGRGRRVLIDADARPRSGSTGWSRRCSPARLVVLCRNLDPAELAGPAGQRPSGRSHRWA